MKKNVIYLGQRHKKKVSFSKLLAYFLIRLNS
jgi:hypothetical protein